MCNGHEIVHEIITIFFIMCMQGQRLCFLSSSGTQFSNLYFISYGF
jgi:hypothetical protein